LNGLLHKTHICVYTSDAQRNPQCKVKETPLKSVKLSTLDEVWKERTKDRIDKSIIFVPSISKVALSLHFWI